MSAAMRRRDDFEGPVLEVRGLTISRGGVPILRGIDWRVSRGEHWAILGANGSGKTSLLAALTGYLTPTAGEVHLLGRRYGFADWPALRRRVGLVSSALRQLIHEEEPAVEVVVGGRYAAIDVRDTLSRRDVRQAHDLLALVNCEALRERPWAYLSQGERQRVLIARALMAQPDLMILDEPCAGLDPVARERFLELLTELGARQSASLILVTHHIEEIVEIFGQTLILREGRVANAGPTPEVLNSANLSAAFGSPLRVRRRHGRYSLSLTQGGYHADWRIGTVR